MSTHTPDEGSREMHDPTKDKCLELEKRLGATEYELAAEIADEGKAFSDGMEALHKQARSAIEDIRPGRDKARR
ncbi:MAG: hypothetical protein JO363_04650 [Solirubrobacterales bacterium]|nr:hypothetical protein [Solirubrobacterales bacterium]